MGKWRRPRPGGLFKFKCRENEGGKDMEELEAESDRLMAFNVWEMPGHYLQGSLGDPAGLHSGMFPR